MGRHTESGFEPTPAIVRDYNETDRNTHVMRKPHDSVISRRGRGDSGYRIEVVEHDCPSCDFDRMVRRHDVNPELPDEVRYWCLDPNCLHFVRDSLSYATPGNYPNRDTDEPAVFEVQE